MPTDAISRRTKVHSLLNWLERVAISLGSVIIGAIGAVKLSDPSIGVTVTIPRGTAEAHVCETRSDDVTPSPGLSVVGVATFSNGDATLTDYSSQNVRLWAKALSRCQGARVEVVGSTSSIMYGPDDRRNNVWLANERANVVAALLKSEGLASAMAATIGDEDELISSRLLNDSPDGKPDPFLMAASRRADLKVLTLGLCEKIRP